jgi:hypothetical protein
VTLLLRFILAAGLALPCAAQTRAADFSKAYKPQASGVKSAIAASNWETYKNLQVDPGKSVVIESEMDFTSADKAVVTVRSTSETDSYFAGLTLTAAWSHPDVDLYSVVEEAKGTAFPYWNTGGAVFQVFGPQFRLILQNSGTQILTIQQVVIGRR